VDHGRLQQEYERRLNASKKEDENLIVIHTQKSKIEQGITRLIDSYAEGFVQKSEFEPRITRLRQRLTDLEQHEKQIVAEEISHAQLQLAICRLEEFHEKVKAGLNEADWQMRRDLIRTLVKRVEIGKDEVKVIFRIPPDLDHSASTEKSLQDCGGSDYPTLGCTHRSLYQTPILHLKGRFQPPLNIEYLPGAVRVFPHGFHQQSMLDPVK
jgi:site-specific DNA recombinase